MLKAALLSKNSINGKHAYSDFSLRKVLVRNKVIVSVGVSLNAIRPSYFVAQYLSRRGYTIIPVNLAYEGELLFGRGCMRAWLKLSNRSIWYRFSENRMRCP